MLILRCYYFGCVGISLVTLVLRWLCWRLNIWLHIFVILYFTPRCLVSVMPCPRKSQKEKTTTDKRRRRFFYTFLYLLGSTTIPWMREFFLNTLKWLNPPVKLSKNVNSLHVCMCPHLVFRASIRVSLLEVCQSPVRVSL